jgi:hypothetical protein
LLLLSATLLPQRACISLLFEAALLCDDDTRLQRAVPYLLTQVSDPSTVIRCAFWGGWGRGGGLLTPALVPHHARPGPSPRGSAPLRSPPQRAPPPPAPPARTLALRCLVRLVASVQALPPGDAKVRALVARDRRLF